MTIASVPNGDGCVGFIMKISANSRSKLSRHPSPSAPLSYSSTHRRNNQYTILVIAVSFIDRKKNSSTGAYIQAHNPLHKVKT